MNQNSLNLLPEPPVSRQLRLLPKVILSLFPAASYMQRKKASEKEKNVKEKRWPCLPFASALLLLAEALTCFFSKDGPS